MVFKYLFLTFTVVVKSYHGSLSLGIIISKTGHTAARKEADVLSFEVPEALLLGLFICSPSSSCLLFLFNFFFYLASFL